MGDAESTDPFDEIERVFDLMSEQFGTRRTTIPVDVIETDRGFVVEADLPGTAPEDIDVTVEDDRLVTIGAEYDRDEREGRYVTRERSRQSASRTVRLPEPVDPGETTASYDAGVLTVELATETDGDETEIPVN